MATLASTHVAVLRTHVSISLMGFARVRMHSRKFFQWATCAPAARFTISVAFVPWNAVP
jgi:hypothetical protein